ncbi:ABC transporter ATP-binding protein [Williamsia phyllosphaerae]|uniref:ABC transporter permease n=1 Tax=Williamsia phyllosphaerae TaxID=885042 RepID=A0ABQ1UBA8_9NOCA|nr:ABC transporter ATP-binding protein [Williamsia phyllosphaerae]GGF13746.1 ABC transporter permease [Williamsia phyllosphaerae]
MTIPDVAPILPVAQSRRTLRWLRTDLARRPRTLVATLLVGVAAAGASVVPIYLLGSLVDRVRDGADVSDLWPLAVVIGVAALLGGLGTGVSTYLVTKLGEQTLADLRESVLARALDLPADTIDESGRGDLLSRVGADVGAVGKAVSQVVPTMINAFFLGVLSLVGMAGIDWRLGLAGALAIPAYILALRWYLPRSAPLYRDERMAIAARAQVMVESLQGIKTIDAYERHAHHRDGISVASARARDLSIAVFTQFTRFVGRINRAEFIGLAAILVVGFLLVRDGADSPGGGVTVGAVTAAALLFHRLFNPIGMLMFNFDEVQAAGASLSRLVGVVDIALPDTGATSGRGDAEPRDATVEVRDVRFAYHPDHPVLQGVSLTIPAGTRTALVGSTGAGKTTLAAIIAGMRDADSGSVTIGGVRVGDIDPTRLRSHVATITQEVHVFAGPLIEDLRLVAPDATRDEVLAAVGAVGALDWVTALPEGIDTRVGEGGLTLTAAQAQHIALARLVLGDPRVVVLDEATAEAGSASARDLEDAALAATEGRTTLVVAHRLTQAAVADAIAVMEHGQIIQFGSHAELLRDADGRYAQLWRAWETDAVTPAG